MAKTKPHILEAVKRYNHSPKGKQIREKWVNKNKEHLKEYQAKYRKRKLKEAKKLGMCLQCYHRPKKKNYTMCQTCHDQRLRYTRKQRP